MTWDFSTAVGERNLHLYINGQELPLTGQVSTGQHTLPSESAASRIHVGAGDLSGVIPAGGVYDEVGIWDRVLLPN